MSQDLASKTFVNISYSGITRIAVFALQIAANVILSQILSPSDFGILGFAWIFIGFLTQFSDFGLTSAAVQRSVFDEKVRRTAFTMKAGMGVVLLVFGILAAPLTQLFFDNSSTVNVVRLLSLNFAINSFSFLPNVALTRQLNYKALSLVSMVSSLTNYLLSILLALTGCGFWSIVLANVISSIAATIILMILKAEKMPIGIDRIVARDLFSFGGKLFLSGFIVFVVFNFDNFIVGSVEGASVLGYYALAFKWAAFMAAILSEVALSVLFPTFVKIGSDIHRTEVPDTFREIRL